MADTSSAGVVAKVVGLAAAGLAAWLATQAVNQSWVAARGHKPPKAEDPGDAALAEIVVAAAFTGAAVAVARVFATRGTARLVRRAEDEHA